MKEENKDIIKLEPKANSADDIFSFENNSKTGISMYSNVVFILNMPL